MEDHFDRVLGTSRPAIAEESTGAPFIPSKAFVGARPGYIFTTRGGATGYFLDGSPEAHSHEERARKRRRKGTEAIDVDDEDMYGEVVDAEAMLERLEREKQDRGEIVDFDLDLKGLKTKLLAFEKKITKNQKLRVKYSDEPAKFLESEVELDTEIKNLFAVAAAPELFHEFVALGAVASLMGLLSHENTDISISVLSLIQELTDPDIAAEAGDGVGQLVDAMVKDQGLELLVQNLSRLDEASEDDADGVYTTLHVIENLSEVRPSLCVDLCEKTGILTFLLMRLKVRKFDANKLYASEILSILVQSDDANARRLGEVNGKDGIDLLLQALSYYRKREPSNDEEAECIQNMCDTLSSAMLMDAENQTRFRRNEGFELMLRCMKEKNFAGTCAIKVVDRALHMNRANCERFVAVGGLKFLFPAFMGKGVTKQSKKRIDEEEKADLELKLISCLASLSMHLRGDSRDDSFQRFVAKFIEGELEKVDRLVELYSDNSKKLRDFDRRLLAMQQEDDEELDDDEIRTMRLGMGLEALQFLSAVLAVASIYSPRARQRIQHKFHEKNHSSGDMRRVLVGFVNSLAPVGGGDDAGAEAEAEQGSPAGLEAVKQEVSEYMASVAVSFPTFEEGESVAASSTSSS